MSSFLNTQNSILNLTNRIEINDSFLDSLLKKIDKKNRIKELLLSRTSITHLPKRETLLLFPNLEKINITGTQITKNQDYITICYELQSIPKLYYLDINICQEIDVKIILLSLPLLKEVNGQKVDINSMKITFQDELNISTYKFIVDFMQNVNKNNLIFVKNFHDNLSSLMTKCLSDINFHCDKYQNNYNLSIFHSIYKINQYLYHNINNYLLIYGQKELSTTAQANIYKITEQIALTMNFYEGLIRNISTSISIILDKIINQNIEQYFKQKAKEVEKNINQKKKLLDEQLNKEFHNRTMGNFDSNFTYNESILNNSMNKKGSSYYYEKNNDDITSLISSNYNDYNNQKYSTSTNFMTSKKGGMGPDEPRGPNINNYSKEKLNYDLLTGGIKKPKSSCSSHNKGFLIIDNNNTNSDNCSIKTFHQKNSSNKMDEFQNVTDKKRDDSKGSRENSLGRQQNNFFTDYNKINNNNEKNSETKEHNNNHNNHNNINNMNNTNNNNTNSNRNSTNSEIIPLNEFIVLINSIYESKEKEEKINLEKGQPQETLEHHIYTYLTRKYGVKHIVIEKAFSIFSSLRKYSNINSDVLLFAKIIRNDIDESSKDFSKEIKKHLEKLLCNKKIDDDIIKIISNSFYCNDTNTKNIFLNKIYAIKDKNKIINTGDVYNIILELEIKERNIYLKNFRTLFRRVDTDSDGTINSYDTSVLFGIIFDEIKNEFGNDCINYKNKNDFVNNFMKIFNHYIPKSLTFSQIVKYIKDTDNKILELLSKKKDIQDNNDEMI
jgi:hypothetical protein